MHGKSVKAGILSMVCTGERYKRLLIFLRKENIIIT